MTSKTIKSYIVDSFTNEPFKGNPAGVCIIEENLSDDQMLLIAQEFNLSETAFIQQQSASHFTIRYFSIQMEIPLCGHATLASAKILLENPGHNEIRFTTVEGLDLRIHHEDELIIMEFPLYETTPASVPDKMLTALGLKKVINSVYNVETRILLLEIADTAVLANLTPDFEALLKSHNDINGVLVTARSDDGLYDFHSRYFWPWSGGHEDPVTGGTHTFLTPYWAERLGKQKLKSFQASRRTGSMDLEIVGDEKLLIKSQARKVLEGRMFL